MCRSSPCAEAGFFIGGKFISEVRVEDAETEDAQELLEHVDRAAGVILLLDPVVVQSGKMNEAIDDEFGMVQAVRRIREWPGGESLPIALVLTKCDRHKGLIRGEGGLRKFIAKRYAPLLHEVGTLRFFASAAVQAKSGDNGEFVPDLTPKPIGVIEPLTYCLEHVQKEERRRREERAATCACFLVAALVFGLTFLSVWYIGLRPASIEVSADGREAKLVSIAGHTLHTWQTEVVGGIRVAKLADVPAEFGGGRIALIGFSSSGANPYPSALCAFDLHQPAGEPLWISRIEDRDVPQRMHLRNDHPLEFSPASILKVNVFAENPGAQVVVLYHHNPRSQCAVRIYDLAGNVWYQAWHDGYIDAAYWMRDVQLLVLAGLNGLVFWEDREHGCPNEVRATTASNPHPRTVFAIRPQFGHRSADWICPDHRGEGFIEPVWYRCLLPPIEVETLPTQRLGAPLGPWDPGSHVIWQRFRDRNYFGSISFVLNEHGDEIREARVVDDPYLRTDGLPDPDIFFVTDLPPLRSDAVIP